MIRLFFCTLVAALLPTSILAHAQDTQPSVSVTLLSPDNNAQIRNRSPLLFRWQSVEGATAYTLTLQSDTFKKEVNVDLATQTEVDLTPYFGQTVKWSVQAQSPAGTVPSEQWFIRVYDWNTTASEKPVLKETPPLESIAGITIDLRGYLRKRVDKCIQRYFLETPESSPAILQVLRDRDKLPVRDPLVPWAGEFAGKYLTGAELFWRLTRDESLKATIDAFVCDLLACQAPNGYLGPFPKDTRLTGGNWDIWGHYHCMVGLLLYYEDTGYEPALTACTRAADLLCETFGLGGPSLTCDGSGGQMNMAVCHALALLYAKTGTQRYLDLANYIVNTAWNEPGAGHYLEAAKAGKPIWEFPQHRWEALHDYQSLPVLFWLQGDTSLRDASLHIWRSGIQGDRHNTGGVTSGEGFCGSPYKRDAIETCCTVAWIAWSIDILRMTGDSGIADEIEWSTLNSALAAIPYSGRACAYNVPMDGTRTFGVELPWQAPKAGPDLNCCAVNAYRPLGLIAQWGLMRAHDGLTLNFYGPGRFIAPLSDTNMVEIEEQTDYPLSGRVVLTIRPQQAMSFTLHLRIPKWSQHTTATLNGAPVKDVLAGQYLTFTREWKSGDTIELNLDFTPRFWVGKQECADHVSFYRGPLLYAFDGRYSDLNPDQLPQLDWTTVTFTPTVFDGKIEPWSFGYLRDNTGNGFPVCDFSSAGQTGNHYRSWLPIGQAPAESIYP